MKYFYNMLLIAAVAAVWACSTEKDDTTEIPYEQFDRFGVAKWDNPDDFIVKRYYTLVDTFAVKQPDISVVIKVTGDIYTDVEWTIDNVEYESRRVDESSNSADGLIIKTYYPRVEPGFEYKDGMSVEARAIVDKNTIERSESITEEKFESDLLGVNFGMDSLTIKDALESIYGVSRFYMRSETIGVDPVTPHFISIRNGRTLYIFDEDDFGLAEVAEFPGSIWEVIEEEATGGNFPVLNPSFVDFCKRLGLDREIWVTPDGTLEGEYEWEREGIVYRLVMRDDVFPVEPEPEPEPEPGDGDGDGEGVRGVSVRTANPCGDPNGTHGEGEGDDKDGEEENPTLYYPNSIGISYTKITAETGR